MAATETVVGPRHNEAIASRRPRAEVPSLIVLGAALVLVVNIVVMFLGAWRIGISWDEPIHVQRLQSWFDTEWYLPPWQMFGNQPAPGVEGLYVYGPVAALVAHVMAVLLGTEGLDESSLAAEAYAARHMAVALFAVVGLGAVATTARLLLRSWRWGLVAAAMLSAIPAWTGHAMFNIKDTPVAAGYALVTLGVVALARPGSVGRGRLRSLGVASLALGTIVAVGTRPGMWVPVLFSVAGMLILTFWGESRGRKSGMRGPNLVSRATSVGTALAIGYVVLLAVYPQLFAHPARLMDAVADSSEYPWNGLVLTNGSFVAMPPPPSYLPLWFGAQTPVVILILAVTGLIASVVLGVRLLLPRYEVDLPLAVGSALVTLQAMLMPVAGVVTKAVLYDGTRQVLFVLPALAVLAAVGARLLVRRSRQTGGSVLPAGVWTVVVVGLVVPTVSALALFPYSFTWFNGVTAIRPIDGRWMTEYWRTSARELIPALPSEGPESCGLWGVGQGLNTCSTQPQFKPYWDTRGSAASGQSVLGPGEYYYLAFNRGEYKAADGCTEVGAVRRPLFGQSVTMSLVSRCAVPLAPYPAGGIRTNSGSGDDFLLWGWYPSQALGVWSRSSDAQVGFVLPESLRDRDVRLSVVAVPYVPAGGSQTVTFTVNGVEMRRSTYSQKQNAGTVEIVVPGPIAWSGDGRFAVTVSASIIVSPVSVGDGDDGRPLGVAVGSVTVEGVS